MNPRKLSAFYGLKWNPFLNDIPVEALCKTPRIDHFTWRVEELVMHGGFALVSALGRVRRRRDGVIAWRGLGGRRRRSRSAVI